MRVRQCKQRAVGCLVILCGLLALSVAVAPIVSARSFRLGKLPDKGRNFGCGTCHVNPRGGGKRTSFGKDYGRIAVAAGEKYTEALGALDSDGDGSTNDQEFAVGTNPGDPQSKP
jgi:hypothetical protein